MMFFGSSEIAGNVLRSSKALRASLALRHWVVRSFRMTTTPTKHQLWHPKRGISFSPATRSPNFHPQDRQAWNENAIATNQARGFTSESDTLDSASLYPKLEELSLSTSENGTPKTNGATFEAGAADKSAASPPAEKQDASSETNNLAEPPVSVLPFKMVDSLFYAAKKAPVGSKESFWSYNQYRGTVEDGTEQKVKVHYCRSKHTMEQVCQKYFMNEKVLGFDLEWVENSMKHHSAKRNVSLIQLASPSRIGLFHVALFNGTGSLIGPSFKAIMEDSSITKVGVAIKGDATRLRNFLGVDSKGLLELSHLYRLVKYLPRGEYKEINRKVVTLATQVGEFLHLPLFKGLDVRASDWTKALNMEQVIYSASDAYAGLQLYAILEYHRKQLDPCPPTPYHAELNRPIRIAGGEELATSDDPTVDAIEETELEASANSKPKSVSPKRPSGPKDSRVEIAEDRVACYKLAHPDARANVPQLRAYYLWHDQGLDPQTIAQVLRDPPLKMSTVTSYILGAVQHEKLPIDVERMRQEVACMVEKENLLRSRWPSVADAIAVQDE
ncbi:ribonuclease H-like protein [Hypoxylon trugodes]|uniref:ribonuclease H-like protein n=1 Tax=Hypoxylon trugodes TaxID=326681 RepID=UPI00218CBCBD|nr:ribonuclease H-like protein [Hypoxylon trugodes]KAI1390962.1 ribonuclease H-like protein [Hypoxylon trugodes]